MITIISDEEFAVIENYLVGKVWALLDKMGGSYTPDKPPNNIIFNTTSIKEGWQSF